MARQRVRSEEKGSRARQHGQAESAQGKARQQGRGTVKG
jgi:hypothetical protein